MARRPNVLWLMSDQHNANCVGFAEHPNVQTPNMDRIADEGVVFTRAFCNNPICSPSRICFMTGQYCHTHRMFGNDHSEIPEANPNTLACQFRRYGYQTAVIGKAHMVRRWDEDGFERIRYTDLCDATHLDPTETHYFKYLEDLGLSDFYEEGSARPGQEYTMDGSAPAKLPYRHSIEHYTGNESLAFLKERDDDRPFFLHMSFQRPHAPIAPAAEHFDMYDPDEMVLPDSAVDYFERCFAGKPEFMQKRLADGCGYPLADPNPDRLKRCLASYYTLITAIDSEIGRVLDYLDEVGELENTVVLYCADHGDFAGDHGLFHKNFGIYDSIHRIPFVIRYPGGPSGATCDAIVESVDWYPTLCRLCDIPVPDGRDGRDLVPVVNSKADGKEAAFCEWDWGNPGGKVSAIRTRDFRLVFYGSLDEGEVYDHRNDPGEIANVWADPEYADVRFDLLAQLMRFTLQYRTDTGRSSHERGLNKRFAPTNLVHKGRRYWRDLKEAYTKETVWPPGD